MKRQALQPSVSFGCNPLSRNGLKLVPRYEPGFRGFRVFLGQHILDLPVVLRRENTLERSIRRVFIELLWFIAPKPGLLLADNPCAPHVLWL